MDENTITTVTTAENTAEETTPAPETADRDDWSDVDSAVTQETREDGDETGAEPAEPEADQPTETEPAQEETGEEAQETGQEEADQPTFELKHLGETKTVNRDEVITLAQKGLNYDHIRSERDAARQEVERLTELENFLKELAGPGRSVDDLIDSTRASVMAEREGIDQNIALQRVKLDRDRAAFEAEKRKGDAAAQAQKDAEKKQQDSFLRFAKEYPDLDPKEIPQEVWMDFHNGKGDLLDLYTRHENKTLRQQLKTMQEKQETEAKNQKNKARSTGSQQSDGGSQKKDLIDLYWDDGT
jgi:hypothetical protein